MAEKDQFNIKSISRAQREAHKDFFFRLYRKTKCVKQAAELTGISLKTATTWVRAYKDNGNKVKREGKRNLIALREALDPIELQENIQKSLKRLFHLMKPESIL